MDAYLVFVEKITDPLYTEFVLEIYFKCVRNKIGEK